jgi:hypothetical protein
MPRNLAHARVLLEFCDAPAFMGISVLSAMSEYRGSTISAWSRETSSIVMRGPSIMAWVGTVTRAEALVESLV